MTYDEHEHGTELAIYYYWVNMPPPIGATPDYVAWFVVFPVNFHESIQLDLEEYDESEVSV